MFSSIQHRNGAGYKSTRTSYNRGVSIGPRTTGLLRPGRFGGHCGGRGSVAQGQFRDYQGEPIRKKFKETRKPKKNFFSNERALV